MTVDIHPTLLGLARNAGFWRGRAATAETDIRAAAYERIARQVERGGVVPAEALPYLRPSCTVRI